MMIRRSSSGIAARKRAATWKILYCRSKPMSDRLDEATSGDDATADDGERVEMSLASVRQRIASIAGVGNSARALAALVWLCRGIAPRVHQKWVAARAAVLTHLAFLASDQNNDAAGIEACRHFLAVCALRLYPVRVRVEHARGGITTETIERRFEAGASALATPAAQVVEHRTAHPWQETHVLALDPFALVTASPYRDLLTRDSDRIIRELASVKNPIAIARLVQSVRCIAFGGEHLNDESFARVMRRARDRAIESELFAPVAGTTVIPFAVSDYDDLGRDLERTTVTVWIPPQPGQKS